MSENFLSRVEEILTAMINGDEYSEVPQSRVEALLLELKDVIESGGGGKGPFYPAGNIDYDDIPAPSEETLGAMYNVNDAFITTNEFVEGAGIKYPAGTNVGVVNVGTVDDPVYKFDAYAGAYVTDDALSSTSENPVQNKVVKAALDGKATGSDLSALAAIVANKANSADLATVATSGSYNDLTGVPSIPTKTSDLTNDSDFTDKSYVDTNDALRELAGSAPMTYDEYRQIVNPDPNRNYYVTGIPKELYHVYSFYIDRTDNNPATCVHPYVSEYGCDNLLYESAAMNFATGIFNYGSWKNAFFIPRVCMLANSGHVDYYLNPDNYKKKLDGGDSDNTDMSYAGNVMVEFPTIWFKRWKSEERTYVIISDKQLDSTFHAYAHHDKNGNVLPYIYLAAYNGSYDGSKLRSISGIEYHDKNALTSGYIMSNTTRTQEIDFAKANNAANEAGEGWYIEHKAEWDMIRDLLTLMSMSTDSGTAFGRGNDSIYVSTTNTGIIATGTMDEMGLFYGTNTGRGGVKALGIEFPWSNIWNGIAGWIMVNGQQKTKMTYGTEDGSTVDGYNTDGSGYVEIANSTPSGTSGGYISNWLMDDYGLIPTVASGSSSTYLADGLWFNNGITAFALAGGNSNNGLHCGSACSDLYDAAGLAYWSFGARLSYKPLKEAV